MNVQILVLCPFGADYGLIGEAVRLGHGQPVRVLVPESQAQTAAAFGAARIHTLPDNFPSDDEAAFAMYLAEKIEAWKDSVILAPATVRMRSIMPILAWHLRAGLTADCTALRLENGQLLQTRPAFGNSLMADIRTLSPVQMATVRPGTFHPRPCAAAEAVITREQPPAPDSRVWAEGFDPFTQSMPLSQAQVIVAGGLGIGSKEGFEKLEHLAQKLGGALGASRSAVDAGFAPYRCQVGITGVTVSPKIYIAVGISGAVQHLSGMSGAQTVIAINADPQAPIFDYADYGIVGNWETVIDQVLEELS